MARSLGLSGTAGVLQRGHAVAVGDRRVGAGVQQDPDDLLVGRRPVAEDHRLQQRGPAQVVDMVDVDVGLHDPADVVDVATLAGRDHRHPAEAVADRQVGLAGSRASSIATLPVTPVTSQGESCWASCASGSAPSATSSRATPPVVGRREQQRRPVVTVPGLQVGAGAQGDRRRVRVTAVAAASSAVGARGRRASSASAVFRSRVAMASWPLRSA